MPVYDSEGQEIDIEFYTKNSDGVLKKTSGKEMVNYTAELRAEAAGKRRALKEARLKLDALGDLDHNEIIKLQADSEYLRVENQALKDDRSEGAILSEFTQSEALKQTIYGQNPQHAQRIWGKDFERLDDGRIVHKTLRDETDNHLLSVDEVIIHKLTHSPNADSYKLPTGQRGSNNHTNRGSENDNSTTVDALAETISKGGMSAYRSATGDK